MFTFPVEPSELFDERTVQMRGWGIPSAVIARARSRIIDTWIESDGGWSIEWIREARLAESQKNYLLAALCYGAARFPCACTPSRLLAQTKQIDSYLKASEKFSCRFERRTIVIPFNEQRVNVRVHLFSRKHDLDKPIICLSGGVDTYKVELHKLALALAIGGDFLVAAIDMPGTGESEIKLKPNAEQIYIGVINQLRTGSVTAQKCAVVGVSFGAHWAAKLALMKEVTAAVDIGGPVGFLPLDGKFLKGLPNGMPGIVANAVGLDSMPEGTAADLLLKDYSLREQGLFQVSDPSPLLVINGADDPYIPSEETTVFNRFENAEVWQLKGASHCGAEKFIRFAPHVVVWLRKHLHGPSVATAVMSFLADAIFPPTV